MSFPDPPPPFLSVHISDLSCSPGICVLCAGYEGGKWRAEQLAEHAMEWLPEFCLSAEELEGLTRNSGKACQESSKIGLPNR